MASVPTKTHCPYCSLQCGINLAVSAGSVVLTPQDDFPTNYGGLCAKGWTAAELLAHPDRLTKPLVRDERGGSLRPTSWNEALERIVTNFHKTQQQHGRDAVGCFGGGGLTNEKAYQFGKFARVALRTSAIDYNGRFCMSSALIPLYVHTTLTTGMSISGKMSIDIRPIAPAASRHTSIIAATIV